MLFALQLIALTFEIPSDWKSISHKNGIELFEQEIPGSSFVAFAGVSEIDAPVNKVAAILKDVGRRKKWTTHLKDAHIIEAISPNEWVEYDHVKTPFIVRDRDFVLAVEVRPDPKSKEWSIRYRSIEHPKAPKTKYIRGEVRHAAFRLTPLEKNRTRIWAEAHADPKGAIPKWIVNYFQREWPQRALSRLKIEVIKN